jgi:hypothetical protein
VKQEAEKCGCGGAGQVVSAPPSRFVHSWWRMLMGQVVLLPLRRSADAGSCVDMGGTGIITESFLVVTSLAYTMVNWYPQLVGTASIPLLACCRKGVARTSVDPQKG